MSLSQGDRLGRYEILGPIGAGGMGEVWRARDTELGREVAIKVLPESFADDAVRLERFQREAKALAALSHPNLLDIYDVGSSNGLHYAVTELLEGDTLRERITPTGLPWQKVTQIGAGVADGLAAAHGRGIVHRDLKPENLFLTADGRVKILDFGLAAVHEEASPDARTATITETGTVMGTPGYMSPEQVKGLQADARSDIFSLGCVLYEMVAGHRAFGGDTGAEVIASILKEEPPQLSSSGAAVPVDLERTVHRCLEKRPEARFQSAADLAFSLRGVGHSGTAPVMATPQPTTVTEVTSRPRPLWPLAAAALLVVAAAITSWWALTRSDAETTPVEVATTLDLNRIAVVPFVNRTGDPTLNALGHRTADRIAQQLADMEELEVVPPSSVASALAANRATGSDTRSLVGEVTRATAAGIVLSGVIDTSGDQIEIQATLEDPVNGQVVRAFDPLVSDPSDPSPAITTLAERSYIAVSDHLHPTLTFGAGDKLPSLETYLEFRRRARLADRDNALQLFSFLAEAPDLSRLRLMLVLSFLDGDSFRNATKLLEDGGFDKVDLNRQQETVIFGLQQWIKGRYDQAFRVFRDELESSPANLLLRHATIRCALYANRPAAAIETYGGLVPDDIAPPIISVFMAIDTAVAHHLLDQHAEALRLLDQVHSELPRSGLTDHSLTQQIAIFGAMGEIEEIERLLTAGSGEEFLPIETAWTQLTAAHELRAHGFDREATAMAERVLPFFERVDPTSEDYLWSMGWRLETLLILGRDHEAADLANGLEVETAGWRAALLFAGIASARTGDAATAREKSDRLAEFTDDGLTDLKTAPGELTVGRAMIATQLGETDEAIELLRRAFAFGAKQIDEDSPLPEPPHNIFFEPLWDDPEFQEIMKPKG